MAAKSEFRIRGGFTLIELSIVLIVIGLIVGGVLAGQELIRAAQVRATISQIEKYNTAANTFLAKYGALPGDIADPAASQFGFAARGQYAGEGDGNGVIEGNGSDAAGMNYGGSEGIGETTEFWVDLSTARLIDGGFNYAKPNGTIGGQHAASYYMPPARLGQNNYISVWSGGPGNAANRDGLNYFNISNILYVSGGVPSVKPGLTVLQAYSIDAKIDDGYPQLGRVTTMYNTGYPNQWAAGTGAGAASASNHATTAATPGSAITCYDNGSSAGLPQQYSLEISNGSNVNCALSFRFSQ